MTSTPEGSGIGPGAGESFLLGLDRAPSAPLGESGERPVAASAPVPGSPAPRRDRRLFSEMRRRDPLTQVPVAAKSPMMGMDQKEELPCELTQPR